MDKIYYLEDPRTRAIRYIGITSKSLSTRLRGHIRYAQKGAETHRGRWIRSLLQEEIKPVIGLIEETEDRNRENIWINLCRSHGCDLVNGTDGGDGLVNPTQEVKDRIAASVSGFKHTPEAIDKIRAAAKLQTHRVGMTGRTHSEATRMKMSAGQKAKRATGWDPRWKGGSHWDGN